MGERWHLNKLVIDGTVLIYYTTGKWKCRVFEVESSLNYNAEENIDWTDIKKYILKRAKELKDCRIVIVDVPETVSNYAARKARRMSVRVSLAFRTEDEQDLRHHSDIDQWIIGLRDDIASRYGLTRFHSTI